MIAEEDMIRNARRLFHLNLYEAKIWLALLSKGSATAGEMADIAEVPRSRTYDILETMEKKGFLIAKLGRPIKYIAVNPAEVLERVTSRLEDTTKDRIKTIKEQKGTKLMGDLQTIYDTGIESLKPRQLTGSMRSRRSIYEHMSVMIKDAKKEVVIMTTAAGAARKIVALEKILKKAIETGVKVKIACPSNPQSEKAINDFKKLGAEVRIIDHVTARFCIVDDEEILFAITSDEEIHENFDTAIWAQTPYFAAAFRDIFQELWDKAKKA